MRKRLHVLVVSSLIAITLGGCANAGTPPLPNVTVLLSPTSAAVGLGQTQQFQASVTGSADTTVLWEVNGITNGNALSGTVSETGLYTAPMAMPDPTAVTVTAESQVNPFALAQFAAPSPGSAVSGMVGAHVVAVDADTGSVIAGTLGGWSCDATNPPTQFDGSFDLERLPVGHSYSLYAEPLVGLALSGDFNDVFTGLCSSSVEPTCSPPLVNTNFNVRILPTQ
jgi:hypothetical protein